MKLIKIALWSFTILAGLYVSTDVNSEIVVDLVMRGIANAEGS